VISLDPLRAEARVVPGAWKVGIVGNNEVVGKVGEVVTRIRGPVGPGEVCVLLYGCYETLIAYSDFTIERGDEVLVIDDHGSGSVDVLPWPMTTLRAGPDAQGAGGGNER
jgi:hypothetical protein